MADDPQTNGVTTGWMSDVQRAIALILIGTLALVTLFTTVMSVFLPTAVAVTDMAKSSNSNLTNMGLIALGFFFGSNMSKMLADAGQQKIVEKLTSSAPPATGPVAPVAATIPIGGWWNRLSDDDRMVITAAAASDPEVARIVAAPVTGKAEAATDIAYLVKVGLLTQDRADAIQS